MEKVRPESSREVATRAFWCGPTVSPTQRKGYGATLPPLVLALLALGCSDDLHPIRPAAPAAISLWHRTLQFTVVNDEAVAVELRYQRWGEPFTRIGTYRVDPGPQTITVSLPKANVVVYVRGMDATDHQVGSWAKIRSRWNALDDIQ